MSILINDYIFIISTMVLTAIPVGFFAGLFGIGGGLISVPFLFFIFELSDFKEEFLMHLSVGTAFAITIMTATSSVLTHNKHIAVNFKKIKLFSFGVILGVIVGAIFASIINTKFLILFFSLVVFIFSFYLLFNKNNQNKIIPNISFLLKLFLGFISGFISAPMGITGAMMNVPILKYFGYNIKTAIGSSAAIGLIIALFGTISFLFSGLFLKADLPLSVGFVNLPAFLIFVPITTFMARIGANTVHRMNRNKIQKYFGLFLIVIGTKFLYEYFKI